MKCVKIAICLIFLALCIAVPVNAVMSITSVSPSIGYADGSSASYTIVGVNFTTTAGEVYLKKSSSTIDATITSWDPTTIVCRIKIATTKDTGAWTLYVKQSAATGGLEATKAFTVIKEITLTSISPDSAQAGNDSVAFTLTGTALGDVDQVYLYNKDYEDNITADDIDVVGTTKVKGTFDLTDAEEDTYDVCVKDTNNLIFCDLTFDITTNEVGSIDVSSNPIGASIYVDSVLKGTTPATIDDLVAGSHRVILKKSGYQEWGKMVSVTADDTAEVDATLYPLTTYTATPPPTTWVTAKPTTARTTAKSTLKVPTSWADVPTTTASPLDPVVIVGAAGIALGFAMLRRR